MHGTCIQLLVWGIFFLSAHVSDVFVNLKMGSVLFISSVDKLSIIIGNLIIAFLCIYI